jgi:hypothetical protein
MKELLNALRSVSINDEDVRTAQGKYQYPRTFKEVFEKVWQ